VVFSVGEECDIKGCDLEEQTKSVVEREMLREAEEFLVKILDRGECKSKDIMQAAQDAGLSWMTVRRAKIRLGVTDHKVGDDGTHHTVWRKPEGADWSGKAVG
jgi:hypothetical protein